MDRRSTGGGLSDQPRLRDYNNKMFLTNLIWNGRDQHQCFQFGPADSQQVRWMITKDTQASVWFVTGAWAVSLFRSGRSASEVRAEAALLQQVESKLIKTLQSPDARSRRRIMTLAEFLDDPVDVLQSILDDMAGHRAATVTKPPRMVNLAGFPQFLQDLKNQGMHPYLTGDFAVGDPPKVSRPRLHKPYVVGGK